MKRAVIVIVLGMLLVGGCRHNSTGTDATKAGTENPRRDGTGVPATQAMSNSSEKTVYTCPMHPEVVSDEPGNCPKCGMKLVPKK